jgi:tRNA(adenine34) deaminase
MNTFGLNHKPEIISGVLEKECSELLSSFFSDLRERRKREKAERKAAKSAESPES